MGVLEASFQLHSGSEGEGRKKKKGPGRGVMIGRRVRGGRAKSAVGAG